MGAVLSFRSGDEVGTVGDLAYSRLRADILFGRLAPGSRLRLEALSQRYGASIGTMRELLNRLVSDGLVVAEGQRGFDVASVSASEFRDLGALRLLLETHAMFQSFAAGDLDWEGRVVAAHHKLSTVERRMLDGADAAEELWKQCDREFHHALISACGSAVLMATHAPVYDKYLRYQMIAVVFRGEAAAREHGMLLECALARDGRRASEVLSAHIEGCIDYALAGDRPAWLQPKLVRGTSDRGSTDAGRALLNTGGQPRTRRRERKQRSD
jgi:DNA-binding GntR family transcriptional regulator